MGDFPEPLPDDEAGMGGGLLWMGNESSSCWEKSTWLGVVGRADSARWARARARARAV